MSVMKCSNEVVEAGFSFLSDCNSRREETTMNRSPTPTTSRSGKAPKSFPARQETEGQLAGAVAGVGGLVCQPELARMSPTSPPLR